MVMGFWERGENNEQIEEDENEKNTPATQVGGTLP